MKSIEEKLFERLSEKEKKERIKELGSKEAAIEQCAYELALKSMDKEKDLSPEKKEEFEKLKKSASSILKSFKLNPVHLKREALRKKENLVIVVENEVDDLVKNAFYEEARRDFGDEARMVVISNLKTSGSNLPEAARKKMLSATNLLLLGIRSLTHSKATKEAFAPGEFKEKRVKKWLEETHRKRKMLETQWKYSEEILSKWRKLNPGAAIISIPDAYKESFLHECYKIPVEEIEKKTKKIKELFEKTKKAHITSPAGTDVWIELDHTKYPVLLETGMVGKGEGMNAPSGETAVRPANINGLFVVDGFCADVPLETNKKGEVKHPIVIEFREGIAHIQKTSPEAEKLIKMCEIAKEMAKKEGKEKNPYQIAEFAIGVLGKPGPDGKINFTLKNATIDEKLTLHLAIGADHFLGGENDVPIHIDFGGQHVSVVLITEEEKEIEILKKGKLMINEKGEELF